MTGGLCRDVLVLVVKAESRNCADSWRTTSRYLEDKPPEVGKALGLPRDLGKPRQVK